MRTPFRRAVCAALILATVSAADPPPVAQPLTPDQRQKLAERDRLSAEAATFEKAGKRTEAVAVIEKALVLSREVYGPNHASVAGLLNRIGHARLDLGEWAAARAAFRDLVGVRGAVFGPGNWRLADARLALADVDLYEKLSPDDREAVRRAAARHTEGEAAYRREFYPDALAAYGDAAAVRKRVLGPGHPDTARTLSGLGDVAYAQRRYADAELLYAEALSARRAAYGSDHPFTAASLSDLGWVANARGRYADAASFHEQALTVRRAAYGAADPVTLASMTQLARTYRSLGRYADAEPLAEGVLVARRKALGPDHPDTVRGLDDVAALYYAQGRYADCRVLHEQILAARRKAVGPDHPDTAASMDNLARTYYAQGRYADAEPLYKDVLRILRAGRGADRADTARVVTRLGNLYYAEGRYADAEPLFAEAVGIYKAALGPDHPETADGLHNLALVTEALGRPADAVPLLEHALQVKRGTVGPAHPETAQTLSALASVYKAVGRHADAVVLHEDALRAAQAALGPDHPHTVAREYELASAYQAQGRSGDALPLLEHALRFRRAALGPDHPHTAATASRLADLYRARGRSAEAESLSRAALSAVADHLDVTAAVQSEAAQLSDLAAHRWIYDNFLACTAGADPVATYAVVLRWQGAVTARQAFFRAARATDPTAAGLLADLTAVTRQLAALTTAPPPDKAAEAAAKRKELAERRTDTEAKLAARSAGFDRYLKNRALTPADLQKCLPADTALVDYVGYGPRLAAFVVRRDSVARVELGFAPLVAALADAFRPTMARGRPTTGQPDDPAPALRKLIWDPLAKELVGAKVVLVCPDGPLCRVPFAALPGADPDKYLIEEVAVAVAPVPRLLPELLAERGRKPDAPPTLLAVGDVDFNAGPAAPVVAAAAGGWKRKRAGGPRAWDRLPGTAGEVSELADAFRAAVAGGKPAVLRAAEPTEAAVRDAIVRYEYLHFATHGFFADPADAPRPAARSDGPSSPAANPGLLSGLVLAGANHPAGEDDGVLTALEVGDLDLSRVELAVLSACETGLGQTAGGEGVLGLQRAFQVAGARTTVTSLWKVDDAATRTLMRRFYDGFWKQNLGSLEALRAAQLDMLANGKSRGLVRADEPAVDAKPARTPPFYWAAFTLAGDWR